MGDKIERLTFGEFVLDRANALLWRAGGRVLLRPKPFAVLCCLVERAGELVTKEDLLDIVWSNLHVTESSLSVSINALRLALGDNSKSPRFVETVPRRGYRFFAPVAVDANPEPATAPNPQIFPPIRSARRRWWVGRESALRTMELRLDQAARGQRQIVFVTGEAGIGKTTFAEMLTDRVSGRNVGVLIGRCIEHFGADEAFLPLNEALSDACAGPNGPSLLRRLRDCAPTWLDQLPGHIEGRDRAALQSEVFGASRERMLREFCELVEALSQERPWIIIIEDLHWSDYATLDVVSRLAQRTQPAAAMFVATYRPGDAAAGDHPTRAVHQELQIHGRCSELALDRLSLAEVEQYLILRFGAAELARALAPMILRRTGGHPLFVVSLVDYSVNQGEILKVNGCWRLAPGKTVLQDGMPSDLHAMIARQIDRLTPEEQRLLEAASAAGIEFSAAAVAGGMNRDAAEAEEACEELARKGQVLSAAGVAEWPDGTVSGRYGFLHALYQEVLYQRLAPGRRVLLHRQIGATLERGYGARTSEIAAVLALHFEEGRDFTRAVRYLAEAADSSIKRFGNQEAATYLTRALGLVERLPPGEDRLSVRLNLLNKRGWVRRSAGDLPGALADIAVMVACAAEANHPTVEVTGLMDLSQFGLYVDRSRCLELAHRALVKSEALDDEVMKALVRGNSSNLNLLLKGWDDDQAAICRDAMEATARSLDPKIILRRYSIDMVLQFLTSNYRACCAGTRVAQEMAQAIGDVYLFAIYNMLEAFAFLHLGEWRRLRQSVSAALGMCRRNANRQAAVLCELSIAWLHAEALDFASARERGEAALDATVEQNPFNFFLGRVLLAKAAIGLRDYEEARSQFEQIKHKIEVEGVSLETSMYPHYYYNLCNYWIEVGDLPRAKEQALQLKARAAPQGERTYLALAHCILGEIASLEARYEDAGAEFAHAIAIVEAAEVPLAAWRVYGGAAAYYESVGETGEAEILRALGEEVVDTLAGMFDADDPLRTSFLEGHAAEARRWNPVSPAVPKYQSAPLTRAHSSHGGNGSTLDKPRGAAA